MTPSIPVSVASPPSRLAHPPFLALSPPPESTLLPCGARAAPHGLAATPHLSSGTPSSRLSDRDLHLFLTRFPGRSFSRSSARLPDTPFPSFSSFPASRVCLCHAVGRSPRSRHPPPPSRLSPPPCPIALIPPDLGSLATASAVNCIGRRARGKHDRTRTLHGDRNRPQARTGRDEDGGSDAGRASKKGAVGERGRKRAGKRGVRVQKRNDGRVGGNQRVGRCMDNATAGAGRRNKKTDRRAEAQRCREGSGGRIDAQRRLAPLPPPSR